MGVAIPIFGHIGSSLGRHHGKPPRRTERFGVKVLLAPVKELGAEDLALLSPEEEERARRFRSSAARAEFIAARTLLRRGLAEHTATKPDGLRLDCTELGKPYLVQDAWPAVEFSLSHTDDRIAIAIADGLAVGVDVERIRPFDDDMAAAAEFMTPEELEEFSTLPACERDACFFRVWTRKEAVLKAAGAGFTIDARTVHVGLGVEETGLVRLPGRSEPYRFRDLAAGDGYAAAVAVAGDVDLAVTCREPGGVLSA